MNKKLTSFLSKKEIIHSFNHAAKTYDGAAFLQREIADRLIERLELIPIKPKRILDLGAGTGYSTKRLEKLYKGAKVIAVDIAEQMLRVSQQEKKWFDRKRYVCADAEKLPLQDNSMDLIFSNLMLHWCTNVEEAICEMSRVLRPGGLLLFSTLGPDTFYEIRQSWSLVDAREHVHLFLDMHEIGDYLQQLKFKDPVIDMEFLTLTYNELRQILVDLKNQGTHNIAKDRLKGLTGKKKFDTFVKGYEQQRNAQGYLPLTYEVIYGIGWGQSKESIRNEYYIPIETITKR